MKLSFQCIGPVGLGLGLLAGTLALVWLAYRRFLPGKETKFLLLLDLLAAIGIILMLLRAEIILRLPGREKGRWAILIDVSKSMGLGKADDTRLDRVKNFLGQQKAWSRLQPSWFVFGEKVRPIVPEEISSLQPQDRATRLRQAVKEVAGRLGPRGAGIIVISDGQETDIFPDENFTQNLSCPVYCVGVEDEPVSDLSISDVVTNSPVYSGDRIRLDVSVRQTGFDGQSLSVSLHNAGKLVAQKSLPITQPLMPTEFILPPLPPGEHFYQVTVEAKPEEQVVVNNSYPVFVRVISGRIRILYIETSLRWEYKFLKRYLETDSQVEPVFLVRVAENVFQQAGGESLEIPADIFTSSFLNRFDILILGNFDFTNLTSKQLQALIDFVTKAGKSLLLLGGDQLLKGVSQTPLETILPVMASGQPYQILTGDYTPVWTEEGKTVFPLEGLSSLPPLDRINNVRLLNPGASVLLVKGNEPSVAFLSLASVGAGRCLILGSDVTWKWAFGETTTKAIYEFFWTGMLRTLWGPEDYLGLGRELPEIVTVRRIYPPGQPVEVRFVFSEKQVGKVNYSVKTPDNQTLPLFPEENVAKFIPRTEGVYTIRAEAGGKSNLREIVVTAEGAEMAELGVNEPELKKIASLSRGQFFRLSESHSLKQAIYQRQEFVTRSFGLQPENKKYWVFVVYLLMNLCWWQRRRQNII
ncbi:MAG: VWA domain-containing protein [Candidatus Omnitrophica bacterium]|nr:VWA domain-containing protein [Candidatus Omnitrophota bacterium]